MKDLKEILYTKAKVNSCEHIIKTYPFLEKTILEAINEALHIHDVVGRSEQLVCGCGSDDIYVEPKVYNCQDCGKSWK